MVDTDLSKDISIKAGMLSGGDMVDMEPELQLLLKSNLSRQSRHVRFQIIW